MKNIIRTNAGGSWPVMVTPFNDDKSIDWNSLDRLTDWYINSGSAGLFSVCQSSEMYLLNDEERLEVAKRVLKKVDGKIPVIATGTFTHDISQQSEFIKKMHDTGVDAVVCLVNHLAEEDESEEVLKTNTENLLNQTGDIPLGLYECPAPYNRKMETATVEWAAKTERFYWMKETTENINIVRAKTEVSKGTNLSLYNAHTASLLESLNSGTIGFSGIAANFYPSLFSWVVENFDKEKENAEELNKFFVEYQKVVDHKYVASAKQYLKMIGIIKSATTRRPELLFDAQEMEALERLGVEANKWYEKLGLPILGE